MKSGCDKPNQLLALLWFRRKQKTQKTHKAKRPLLSPSAVPSSEDKEALCFSPIIVLSVRRKTRDSVLVSGIPGWARTDSSKTPANTDDPRGLVCNSSRSRSGAIGIAVDFQEISRGRFFSYQDCGPHGDRGTLAPKACFQRPCCEASI